MPISHLLLGGNQGNRLQNLAAARSAIAAHCGEILAASHIYETEAWGMEDQPPFLNQALEIDTQLPPERLLETILQVEAEMGRVREEKYGPRTIDIDILFYGRMVLDVPGLTIPHPQLHRRRFALQCMMDIAPALEHPVLQRTIAELLAACNDPLAVMRFLY